MDCASAQTVFFGSLAFLSATPLKTANPQPLVSKIWAFSVVHSQIKKRVFLAQAGMMGHADLGPSSAACFPRASRDDPDRLWGGV